jgi:serine/threonine protein phosphatase PrpC
MTPRFAGRTDRGRVRERNEDALRMQRFGADLALVVCDGLGGHDQGDAASRIGGDTLIAHLGAQGPGPARVFDALRAAAEAVHDAFARNGDWGEPATTAVVALSTAEGVFVGWIGDSRLYHLRDGAVVDRTTDHSRATAPDQTALTRCLGPERDVRPDVWGEPLALRDGDVVLLCSDGLWDLVTDDEIAAIACGASPDVAVEQLVDLALERGAHDNVTVAILGGPPPVPPPRRGTPTPTRSERDAAPPVGAALVEAPATSAAPPPGPLVAPTSRGLAGWAAALGGAALFGAGVLVGWVLRGVLS